MSFWLSGGNNRARTCDPLLVRQMLSQLSYAPVADNFYIISYLFRKVNYFFKLFLSFFFFSSESAVLQQECIQQMSHFGLRASQTARPCSTKR